MAKELSNLSKLSRTAGMVYVACPICGCTFARHTSHVARVANPTCSVACAAKAREVRVFKPCIICGKEMEQTPSEAARVVTCSKRCSFVKKTRGKGHPAKEHGSAIYLATVKKLYAIGRCENCTTNIGPWAVRGLEFDYSQPEVRLISAGSLWCRSCHLKLVAPLGSIAREGKRKQSGLTTRNNNIINERIPSSEHKKVVAA
ncbi:hypothetical protein [Pseudomonas sp. GM80]|uniref:hypothetical protein n=1 Tax=Pseudomonas sp. GM80 TaxID=1144339 RepID=UPI00026F95BF|nr:hypothetical protein [Pseudomonas sp. GM80]EJN18698.1 hypothetical protein PMI37_05728 [Pseudomonas sp. GM80]